MLKLYYFLALLYIKQSKNDESKDMNTDIQYIFKNRIETNLNTFVNDSVKVLHTYLTTTNKFIILTITILPFPHHKIYLSTM